MFDRNRLGRALPASLAAAAGAVATGLFSVPGAAMAQMNDDFEFDSDRAFVVDETIFEPFLVTDDDVVPLREALESGALQPDSWLVIMEHEAGRLAMVMDQMAYHHVAQGDIAGEPWMVSF